jgi:hypothetical protein
LFGKGKRLTHPEIRGHKPEEFVDASFITDDPRHSETEERYVLLGLSVRQPSHRSARKALEVSDYR